MTPSAHAFLQRLIEQGIAVESATRLLAREEVVQHIASMRLRPSMTLPQLSMPRSGGAHVRWIDRAHPND
jgi:hypothetical protein